LPTGKQVSQITLSHPSSTAASTTEDGNDEDHSSKLIDNTSPVWSNLQGSELPTPSPTIFILFFLTRETR